MVWSFKAGEEEAEDYGLWRPHWMGGGDRLLWCRYYGDFYLRNGVSEQLLELEVITDVFFHGFSKLSNRRLTSIFTIWSRGVWLSSTLRNIPQISPTPQTTSIFQWAVHFLLRELGSACDAYSLWCWPGAWVVSPVQWGRPWPAQSGFKLLLSDQIFWFVAGPGAALELVSISSDLW